MRTKQAMVWEKHFHNCGRKSTTFRKHFLLFDDENENLLLLTNPEKIENLLADQKYSCISAELFIGNS